MKVLQINSVCGIGSTGRIATDIHNILIEGGYQSYIGYGRDNPKNCENSIKIGNKKDIYFHLFLSRIFDKHGFGSSSATHKFINDIKNINPDVIHLHNIHGYYLNIQILFEFLKEFNKPVIWTLHDCWSFTGHCAYFDYIGCDKWEDLCYKCPAKKAYPSSLMIDNSKENYLNKKQIFNGLKNLTIITPSEWLAEKVRNSFLGHYPIQVINNGIDVNVFKPVVGNIRERFGLKDKFIILGVASIWDRRKGLQYFKDLSVRLDANELILLVGLSDEQVKDLPNNIISIPKTNNIEELAEIYSCADVFVNPTLEDNFPTTNLESLACGTPVITFNTGGSVESVDHGKTGFIVEKGNVNELLDYIRLIKQKSKSYFFENATNSAKSKYDKRKKYKEYEKLYISMT